MADCRATRFAIGSAQEGDFLKLTRPGATRPALTVTRGAHFPIGRTVTTHGCSVRLDESLAGDASARISRIHVTARWSGGRVALCDGDGVSRSTNGSSFDDERLSPDHATPVARSGLLDLGGCCQVQLTHRTLPTERAPTGADDLTPLPDAPPGELAAVTFAPRPPAQPNVSIWLFRAAGLRFAAAATVEECALAQADAILLLHASRFWLVAPAARAGLVQLDEAPLTADRPIGLTTGQRLACGEHRLRVSVTGAGR